MLSLVSSSCVFSGVNIAPVSKKLYPDTMDRAEIYFSKGDIREYKYRTRD